MEPSDLELLKSVPLSHVLVLIRTRHIPLPTGKSGEQYLAEPETLHEVGELLFAQAAIEQLLHPHDGESVFRAEQLEATDILILQELVACGGRANSRDLALYLALSERLGGKNTTGLTEGTEYGQGAGIHYPTAHPHGVFEQALRRLLLLGLVFWGKQTNFVSREYASGIHDGVLIVPRMVRVVVAASIQKQREEQEKHALPAEELMASERMLMFQRQLYRYWACVAAMRDGLTLLSSSGLLTRAALRRVVEQIEPGTMYEQTKAEHDIPYLLFLRLLLMKLGLLRVRNGTLQAAPALNFFELPLFERVRRCYRLWLEDPFWNEMNYLPDVVLRPGPQPIEAAHEEVVRARQAVVARLLQEQHDTWFSINALIARTKLYIPYLLFPRQHGPRTDRYSGGSNPYGWDFRLRRGWLTHREGWHMVEGGFVRTLVTGPLRWLGLVECMEDERGTLVQFSQLSGLLMSSDTLVDVSTPAGRLIVQPNFELVALAPVSEALLVQLDSFAERVSLELIAQYRITKVSITHAVQMGMRAETIIAALELAAGGEIPQNVRYSLVEWERQARRIELWQTAVLLEVDSPDLLDELLAHDETRSLLRRRLSPCKAEVAPQHVATLHAVLWKRDYLPTLTTAPTQDMVLDNGRFVTREPQWQLLPEGRLLPLYPVLDLYVSAEVKRFSRVYTGDAISSAQEQEQNVEQARARVITAQTLQAALSQGMTLDYILRFLQQYSLDGIPPALLIRFKLWGGGYGEQRSITIERTPLLSLPAQILQDIQQDTELRPLLGAEIEQAHRFVRVKQEHLEQVIALLHERGFLIE